MTKRIAILAVAALVAVSAFAGSSSPSSALDLNSLEPGYVVCLKYAAVYADRYPEGEQRTAAYARLRQNCDRTYSSKRLNID
jgi:hypothetical protein